jgi:hypothetical protein
MQNLPREVIDRLVNLGGVEKKLYCKQCNKFTPHISVSQGELYYSLVGQIFGRVNDFNPASSLGVGNPYICQSCRAFRVEGGLLSDSKNEQLQKLRDNGTGGWY